MFKRRDLGVKMMSSDNLRAALGKTGPSMPSGGGEISVSTVQIEGPTVVYEITATIGDHTEIQRHAIGINGTNPHQAQPMTTADLQAALDRFRQNVADTVAWRAVMEESTAQVS